MSFPETPNFGPVHTFYCGVYNVFLDAQNALCKAQHKAPPIIAMVPAALLALVSVVQLIVAAILSVATYILPDTGCPKGMLSSIASRLSDRALVGIEYGIYNFVCLGIPLFHSGCKRIDRLEKRQEEWIKLVF